MTLEESTARTRKHLSLSEKVEVISFFNNVKCSVRKLAKYFNIGKTQAGHIVKQKDRLLELWLANGEIRNGKLRPDSAGYQIDKYVYGWYADTRGENIAVSGPMIQSKALEIARELGHGEFKASNGWLERFRIRHGIHQKPRQGKNGCDAPADLEQWKEKLDSVTSTYAPEDVFGAVETGLFYRAAPEETPTLTSDILSDRDVSDKRLTVLFCASLAGAKERPLVVVKPPPVADCDPGRFTPNCAFSPSARLTGDILARWLGEFDSAMSRQNRSVALLLIGDALCALDPHPKLSNVELLHVPSHLFREGGQTTPHHCVVQDFKIIYRQLLLKRLVELKEEDEDTSPVTRMCPSEGAALVEAAWEKVAESVVLRSFEEVGCRSAAANFAGENEASLDDVSSLLCAYDCDVRAVDYVGVDADLATSEAGGGPPPEILEVLVDGDEMRDILAMKEDADDGGGNKVRNRDVYGEATTSAGVGRQASTVAVGSYSEALRCLRGLEHFYLSRNDSGATVLVNQLIVQSERARDGQLRNAAKTEDR